MIKEVMTFVKKYLNVKIALIFVLGVPLYFATKQFLYTPTGEVESGAILLASLSIGFLITHAGEAVLKRVTKEIKHRENVAYLRMELVPAEKAILRRIHREPNRTLFIEVETHALRLASKDIIRFAGGVVEQNRIYGTTRATYRITDWAWNILKKEPEIIEEDKPPGSTSARRRQ